MSRIILILALTALLFSACTQPLLPPKEVLERTFLKSSSIDTYSFSAEGAGVLRGPRVFSGTFVIEGAVQRGAAWSINIATEVERIASERASRLDGIIHLRAPGNGVLYLKTIGIAGEEGAYITRLLTHATTDGWTRVAYPAQTGLPLPLSAPTQEMIDAQVASILVIADRTDPEGDLYQYDVQLSPEIAARLLGPSANPDALTGTLWIDRRTFTLLRAAWSGTSLVTPSGTLTFTLDVTFASFNETVLPTMPLMTGSTIPLKTIFDTISLDVPLSS